MADMMAEEEAATTARAAEASYEQDAGAEEMPLLFMDGLPSSFQQSAQLAALATFMADSDVDEESGRSSGSATEERPAVGKQPPAMRRRRVKRQSRTPYARSAPSKRDVGEGESSKQSRKKTSDATKELQLYLSMFKV